MENIYPCERLIAAAYHNSTTQLSFEESKAIIWHFCEEYAKNKKRLHPHSEWTQLDWQNIMDGMKFCTDPKNYKRYELSIDEYKPMIEFFLTRLKLKPRTDGKVHDYSMKLFMNGGMRGNCYFQAITLQRK